MFEEYSEGEGEGEGGMVLVTRDPTLADNALLPGQHWAQRSAVCIALHAMGLCM